MNSIIKSRVVSFSLIVPYLGIDNIDKFSVSQLSRCLSLYDACFSSYLRTLYEETFLREVRLLAPENMDEFHWCEEKILNRDLRSLESVFRKIRFWDNLDKWQSFAINFYSDELFVKIIFPQGGFLRRVPSLNYPSWDLKPPNIK